MTEEFKKLQQLIRDGKAVIGLNKYFIMPTYLDCLRYRSTPLFLALVLISLPFSWWLCIPISLLLAWKFASWWIILLGIGLPWIVVHLEKEFGFRFVRKSASTDERVFEFLWSLHPFRITISSTSMETRAESLGLLASDDSLSEDPDYYNVLQSKVFISPPNDWKKEITEKATDF